MYLRCLMYALFIGGSLLLSKGIVQAEYPEGISKWQACQASDDCTISNDPCRQAVGINKKYHEEYTRWSEQEGWHCRVLVDKGISENAQVSCLNHKCQVGRPTGVQTAPLPPAIKTKKGLTWGLVSHSDVFGIDRVGCYGKPHVDGSSDGPACDPYQGDTSCAVELPILCLKTEGLPRPNYAVPGKGHAMPVEYYNGWTGGHIKLTQPVRGDVLTSVEGANKRCEEEFGSGYRMAEHHDGMYVEGMDEKNYYGATWPAVSRLMRGGWHWYAYGNITGDKRFWVHINDQPRGNCWEDLTIPAAKPGGSRASFDPKAAKIAP